MNHPSEVSSGVEPISKHLREKASKQWAQTWGAELAEVDRAMSDRRDTVQDKEETP